MAISYPPQVLYPKEYDSDYTLFQVYNTSETTLSENLEAWATEIAIVPVDLNKPEIWANNGFVNIDGELIYYDNVEKDYATGKIIRLLGCIRNLGGSHTKFNAAGT